MEQDKNNQQLMQKFSITKSDQVLQEHFDKVLESKKFQDYIKNFSTQHVDVSKITVINVFMFGPNVGFVNFIVDAQLQQSKKRIPGYVFLRGKSVAIVVIVNQTKMLLVRQFRVPVGQFLLECPAGMMDEEGNFTGVAAKEMSEETGLKIIEQDLIYLGSMYPSPGGCDEEVILYGYHCTLTDDKIKEMEKKSFGDNHEDITLVLTDYNPQNILKTKDAKLISACYALEKQIQNSQNSIKQNL